MRTEKRSNLHSARLAIRSGFIITILTLCVMLPNLIFHIPGAAFCSVLEFVLLLVNLLLEFIGWMQRRESKQKRKGLPHTFHTVEENERLLDEYLHNRAIERQAAQQEKAKK